MASTKKKRKDPNLTANIPTENYDPNAGSGDWSDGKISFNFKFDSVPQPFEFHSAALVDLGANVTEGYATAPQANFFTAFLTGYPHIKNIVEIGFNAGHSSATFLGARDDITVTSFDLGKHDYVRLGEQALAQKYPNRLTLILGKSTVTVPRYTMPETVRTFDMCYIDGGHHANIPYLDIVNLVKLVKKGGVVFVDDAWEGYPDILTGMKKAEVRNLVKFSTIVRIGDRAWAIGTVN